MMLRETQSITKLNLTDVRLISNFDFFWLCTSVEALKTDIRTRFSQGAKMETYISLCKGRDIRKYNPTLVPMTKSIWHHGLYLPKARAMLPVIGLVRNIFSNSTQGTAPERRAVLYSQGKSLCRIRASLHDDHL